MPGFCTFSVFPSTHTFRCPTPVSPSTLVALVAGLALASTHRLFIRSSRAPMRALLEESKIGLPALIAFAIWLSKAL